VKFGAHLPLMDFGGNPYTLAHLAAYTETARDLGYDVIAVNDHLVWFAVPWLDGPTALASIVPYSGSMQLFTTVALPVVRGPVPVAQALAAIDRLSGGRLVAGIGPGSSEADYAAVGIDFDERWVRLEEAVATLRSLWGRSRPRFEGRFYSAQIELKPGPITPGGPPIWIGSWGSKAGLRRVARLADGWLASAYNTTPTNFATAWERLGNFLHERGRDRQAFPNGLSTMWFYISQDDSDAERVLRERVLPAIDRPEETLRERLPIGSAEAFAAKLRAFGQAGLQMAFIWPVADEIRQLQLFREKVVPLL
jgi:alkanesulfonate monooxygenase SsuD/methylene tetrahydromethanopterin reductase-like flavin-dependent oxidoreductase (luciferase family)